MGITLDNKFNVGDYVCLTDGSHGTLESISFDGEIMYLIRFIGGTRVYIQERYIIKAVKPPVLKWRELPEAADPASIKINEEVQ